MKATSIEGIMKIQATATGNRCNQHRSINWSYLNLGRVARARINKKEKIQVLSPRTTDCRFIIESFKNNSGKW